MSSEIAWRAASFTSAGAAKSGKPCERLTASCFNARRVISRMTDSVNCSAFAESMRRAICAMGDSGAVIELKSKVYGRREKKQRERKKKITRSRGVRTDFHGANTASHSQHGVILSLSDEDRRRTSTDE